MRINSCISAILFTRKKTITHNNYNDWKTLQSPKISDFGNWISYEIKPHRGDGVLFFLNEKAKDTFSIERGNSAVISQDEKFTVFKIHPGFDTLRKLELVEVKKEKWVKDSLGILNLVNGEIHKWADIKKFQLSEQGSLLVALSHKEVKKIANDNSSVGRVLGWFWNRSRNVHQEGNPIKELGKMLYWSYLNDSWNGEKQTINNVEDFILAEKQDILIYSSKYEEDKKQFYLLHLKDLGGSSDVNLQTKFTAIGNWGFNENADKFFFLPPKIR